jgi:hypothetical protein
MIYRGDIQEGKTIAVRNISPDNLAQGKFNFRDNISQQGDIKTFTGTTPQEALAFGRVVVKFTKTDEPSIFPNMTKFMAEKRIPSNTGQLMWDYSAQGYFTINSRGTKAVVGFADGKDVVLGGYQIRLKSHYASIMLTSLEKTADLSNTKSVLLTAVARNCNSGFKYFTLDMSTIDNGHSPVMMEPVKAEITTDRHIAAVNVLDQDGRSTGKTLKVDHNSFTVDTAADKTMYYEVVFGN